MKRFLNQSILWLWMVFCIINNSCSFPMMVHLFWKIFSKMLNYLFSSDRPAKCLQNIPLNTCSKTNLFNYLIITIILWWLNFVLLWAVTHHRPKEPQPIIYCVFTHTVYTVYEWAVTHHSQHAHHDSQPQCHSRQVYDLITYYYVIF